MEYEKWIGKERLAEEISKKGNVVFVFAAKWCGYCKRFLPVIDSHSTSKETPKLFVVDADSDEGSIWDDYSIDVVPTIIAYHDGEQVFKRAARPGVGLGEKDLNEALEASAR